MFAITVTEKGGEQRRLDFDRPEITIGRVQGNDVILPKGNVSKRHARIVLKDGKFIIVDLKSTNGTYVNGRKITSPLVVKEADKIYIGDFILGVEEAGAGALRSSEAVPSPQPLAGPPLGASSERGAPLPPPSMGSPLPPGSLTAPPPDRYERSLTDAVPPPVAARALAQPPSALGDVPIPPPVGQGPNITLGGQMMGAAGPGLAPPSPVPPIAPPALARPTPRTAPPRPAPIASPSSPAHVTSAGLPPSSAPSAPMPATGARSAAPPATAPAAASRPRLVGAGAAPVAPMVGGAVKSRPYAVAGRRQVDAQPLDARVVKQLELQAQILGKLVPRLGLDDIALEKLGDEELWQKAESAIVDLVETMDSSGELPKTVDQDQLIKDTLNEALGLGPLEDLLADDKIDEIVVDRRDRILVGKGGGLNGAGAGFSSDESFRRVVERLVAPTGQRIDEGRPLADVRLRDGSRLTAALPPVAVRGACLTLRKPRTSSASLADLVGQGALSSEMADFLTTCITARKNVLVCGAPGAGKSGVLAALAAAAPEGERIVSVEEVAELAIGREDWIALEARPGDGNGVAAVDLVSLLRSALRMRPDRLVVGDVRGGEAFDLVQAMASAADGTLASVSGQGARAALGRLSAMAQLGAPGAAGEALRDLTANAVDVVVHVARYADGVHRVAAIDEVLGSGVAGFQTQELFGYRGTIESGGFAAAGVVPTFYGELEARGLPADPSIFRS